MSAQSASVSAEARSAILFVCLHGSAKSLIAAGTVEVETWADLPMVSDGYDAARDAIVARVGDVIVRMAQ